MERGRTPALRPSRGSGTSCWPSWSARTWASSTRARPRFVWSLANPLLYLAVFSLVFGFFLKNNVPWFAVLFMSGFLICFFNSAALDATGAVVGNANLVKKVRFLGWCRCWPRSASPHVHLVPAAGVLLVPGPGLPGRGWAPAVAAGPGAGRDRGLHHGHVAARLVPERTLPDVQHLLEIALLAWFWLTPIVYPGDRGPRPTWPGTACSSCSSSTWPT